MQTKTFKEAFQKEYEETIKFTGGGVEHSTALINTSGWYTILKTSPDVKISADFAYGKTALFSLTKTYANSDNQALMVAMVGAYCSPVFSVLANSKRNNKYVKIRMTHKNIDGGYTTYIEVYIAEASQNNYDVFLHNQSMRSENDIRFQTVPFLPAEEGTEVIGTEQDL